MALRDLVKVAVKEALRQDHEFRKDCAIAGMRGAIEAYETDSVAKGRVRAFDGLRSLDTAVRKLKTAWSVGGSSNANVQNLVEEVLRASSSYLISKDNSRVDAVRALNWQVAWSYSCAQYVLAARAAIRANWSGDATSMIDGPLGTLEFGNPYDNPDYDIVKPLGPVYRGDTRAPNLILTANGFVSRDLDNPELFNPWWAGHSLGGTQSVTEDRALAINASSAAKTPAGNKLPDWIVELINNKDLPFPERRIKSFVYEMRLRGSSGLIVNGERKEISYLAVPRTRIKQFWVMFGFQMYSVGPIPFPPPPRDGSNITARLQWGGQKEIRGF